MDRNSLLRTLVIALVLLGGYWLFFNKKGGDHLQSLPPEHYVSTPGFVPDAVDGEPPPASPTPATACSIKGNRFVAELSSHGAGLTHFRYTDAAYTKPPKGDEGDARDLTTPDVERWRNLRTLFRDPSGVDSPDDQVKFDRFDWKTEALGDAACRFTYEDATARIVKTVSADGSPFELEVETTLTNLTDAPKKHVTSVEMFAYWKNKHVKGKLGRVSPFQTNLECARAGAVKRL